MVIMRGKKRSKIGILALTSIFIAAACTACSLSEYQKSRVESLTINDTDAACANDFETTKDTAGISSNTSQETSDFDDIDTTQGAMDWRSSAEEFLSGYLSIFGGIDWVGGSENPNAMVTFGTAANNSPDGGFLYYDSSGNIIREAPFLIGEVPTQVVAMEYVLYDLDNSGIPAINILYAYPESSGGARNNLYIYYDGAYHLTESFTYPQYFQNNDGSIIVIEWSFEERLKVSRLFLGNEGIRLELIADWGWDFIDKNPALFDMLNEPLTQIEPLTELQQSMTESIVQIISR
jgi:hypothetical protein